MRSAEQLRHQFIATNCAIRWYLDDAIRSDDGLTARNRSATMIASLPLSDSATLNGSLPPDQMEVLVSAAEHRLLAEPFSGVGIELGAGLGVLAATVAKRGAVRCILAVEACENFAEQVIPRVARQVLGENSDRVVPVLGSFDALEVDDATIDFAVEIDSLHHSPRLVTTLTECARVLRRGGRLTCFDRAHHDDLPDWYREKMLDHVYDDEWVRNNGYPPDVSMTRRENGEHEIRLGEWHEAFTAAGFIIESQVQFVPEIGIRLALKGAISRLPRRARRRLITLPLTAGYPTAWGLRKVRLGALARRVLPGPKPATGFVVRKT
jgi:ubiquinone/menaquinone biosynthesis C-methylase UbiE